MPILEAALFAEPSLRARRSNCSKAVLCCSVNSIASKVGKVPAEVRKAVQSSIDKVLSEYGLEMNGKIEGSIAAALKNYDLQTVKDKYNQVNTVMQYKAKQAYVNGINSVADKLLRKKQKALENSREYLYILNKNAMAAVLGEKSRTEAIRETIAEMSKKGIPAFVDKTGREWSPEAYVDMDIRNTTKNAALAAEFASLDELGQDIILVSSHSGSRPLCAPYQGKLYSRSGKSGTITDAKGKTYTYTPLSETSFGEAAGLFGINCGHRMRGVSEGAFINREKEFDGEETSEEYRKVQRQRAMEREVRKKKTEADMLEAAGDKDAARDLRRLASDEDRKLQDYCRKEGLYYRRDRTEVYGYKKVDISENGGIIKAERNIVGGEEEKYILKLTSKFVNPNERLYINADKIKPIEGYGDIVCHGSPKELLIYGLDDEEWSYSAKEAAEMIRGSNEFKGQSIRLIACQAGAGGSDSIAQQIADELGVNVMASDEMIYINSNGDMFLSDNDILAAMWRDGEAVKETGKWIVFKPRKQVK